MPLSPKDEAIRTEPLICNRLSQDPPFASYLNVRQLMLINLQDRWRRGYREYHIPFRNNSTTERTDWANLEHVAPLCT